MFKFVGSTYFGISKRLAIDTPIHAHTVSQEQLLKIIHPIERSKHAAFKARSHSNRQCLLSGYRSSENCQMLATCLISDNIVLGTKLARHPKLVYGNDVPDCSVNGGYSLKFCPCLATSFCFESLSSSPCMTSFNGCLSSSSCEPAQQIPPQIPNRNPNRKPYVPPVLATSFFASDRTLSETTDSGKEFVLSSRIAPPVPPRNPNRAPYVPPVLVTSSPSSDCASLQNGESDGECHPCSTIVSPIPSGNETSAACVPPVHATEVPSHCSPCAKESDKTFPRSILVLTWHTGPPKKVRFSEPVSTDVFPNIPPPPGQKQLRKSRFVRSYVTSCKSVHSSSKVQRTYKSLESDFLISSFTDDVEAESHPQFSLDLPPLSFDHKNEYDQSDGDNTLTLRKAKSSKRSLNTAKLTVKTRGNSLKAGLKKLLRHRLRI